MTSDVHVSVVDQLRAQFDGAVVAPGDVDYDKARMIFPGGVDRRPAVVVRPTDAEGVARVVAVARSTGLDLAVRSGGHSVHAVCDGGIVLDLSRMRALDVDVQGRTAWAQTGLTAGDYTRAVAEHGLATGFGDTGSVGIGGITLGGGVGFLSRKYGLTIDSLVAAEVVTADGAIRQVDADTEPELFWALRGGGGNFGVATRLRFALQEVPHVVGGMLMLPATPETVAGFVAAAEEAPEDLSTIANVMPAPPMPFVPAEHHGALVVFAFLCHAGDEAAGLEAVRPFRELATPLLDMVRPMPYPQMYPPDQEDYHPTAVGRTMFLDTVGVDEAELILDRLRSSDAPMRVVQLRVLGGAISRVPVEATAYAHRQSRIMANVASFYAGPDDQPVRRAWVEELAARLQQRDTGAYINFLADDGVDRIRAAYPGPTWDRLVAVKRQYDPDNLFRLNHNIPPGPAE